MGDFPDDVVWRAWSRAGRRCECRRTTHNHPDGICGKQLDWEKRGREGKRAWEAHHIVSQDAGGSDTYSNCEILCWNCHSETF